MQLSTKLVNLLFPRSWENDMTYIPFPLYPLYQSWYMALCELPDAIVKKKYQSLPYTYSHTVRDAYHIYELIKRAKIKGEWDICEDLAQAMMCGIRKEIIEKHTHVIVSYVPPDPLRYMQRGYHIPQIIARHISDTMQLPLVSLVHKTIHTPSQTEVSRETRTSQLVHAFEINNCAFDHIPDGCIVCIIDDVMTTGATMKCIVETLLRQSKGKKEIYYIPCVGIKIL